MEGLFTRDISMKHFYTDWDFESIRLVERESDRHEGHILVGKTCRVAALWAQ